MQIVSSYGVEIKKNEYTAPLYAGYFSEGSFLSDSGVCRDLGRTFRNQKSTKSALMKRNIWYMRQKRIMPDFCLTVIFHKMPSYLRRAAIQHALGAVSSYQTRLSLWENGRTERKTEAGL